MEEDQSARLIRALMYLQQHIQYLEVSIRDLNTTLKDKPIPDGLAMEENKEKKSWREQIKNKLSFFNKAIKK